MASLLRAPCLPASVAGVTSRSPGSRVKRSHSERSPRNPRSRNRLRRGSDHASAVRAADGSGQVTVPPYRNSNARTGSAPATPIRTSMWADCRTSAWGWLRSGLLSIRYTTGMARSGKHMPACNDGDKAAQQLRLTCGDYALPQFRCEEASYITVTSTHSLVRSECQCTDGPAASTGHCRLCSKQCVH